jgi:hypothetical protein
MNLSSLTQFINHPIYRGGNLKGSTVTAGTRLMAQTESMSTAYELLRTTSVLSIVLKLFQSAAREHVDTHGSR